MQLKDKVFILTGAARIGVDVANELTKQGAKLAVTYMSTKSAVGDLQIQADLTNPLDVLRVVSETKQRFGKVDGLIHMAANYKRTPWKELNEQTWNDSMRPIARTAFLMTKAVGDELLQNPSGGKIMPKL